MPENRIYQGERQQKILEGKKVSYQRAYPETFQFSTNDPATPSMCLVRWSCLRYVQRVCQLFASIPNQGTCYYRV